MKFLVTGGAGFIGSHLVDCLIDNSHSVIVIDNESASENENFYWNEKAENYNYSICNYNEIESLFENIDCVFHLAAESRIQTATKNPAKTIASSNAFMKSAFCSSASAVDRRGNRAVPSAMPTIPRGNCATRSA